LFFDPKVPLELIYPEGQMSVRGHVELINYQLRQLRSALALAYALGRKLIMPSVVCGYDKAWYALGSRGEFGGAPKFVVPIFNCPLDHYLEVETLDPVQTIREYSFLSNPRTPASVRASVVAVQVDADGGAAEMGRLAAMAPSAKVLNITNLAALPDLSKRLLTNSQAQAFKAKFHHVGGGWCCAPRGESPGRAGFTLMRA